MVLEGEIYILGANRLETSVCFLVFRVSLIQIYEEEKGNVSTLILIMNFSYFVLLQLLAISWLQLCCYEGVSLYQLGNIFQKIVSGIICSDAIQESFLNIIHTVYILC